MKVYLVYQKYNKDFIAYAKSITNNKNRAFDLVQETYVSALEKEKIFNSMNEYQIKGWFFTVIKNKNIDYIRKQNKISLFENNVLISMLTDETRNFEQKIILKELVGKLPEKNILETENDKEILYSNIATLNL